ncbi:uncharacterized protein LOC143269306 [Peromyscus maniculatus bairdii]|uniref:uncharacterized protein LOC143269306 n=1 Tax=Peromyscus maniculatus bairdii TaxID=230844 RepID=UPI003FD1F907
MGSQSRDDGDDDSRSCPARSLPLNNVPAAEGAPEGEAPGLVQTDSSISDKCQERRTRPRQPRKTVTVSTVDWHGPAEEPGLPSGCHFSPGCVGNYTRALDTSGIPVAAGGLAQFRRLSVSKARTFPRSSGVPLTHAASQVRPSGMPNLAKLGKKDSKHRAHQNGRQGMAGKANADSMDRTGAGGSGATATFVFAVPAVHHRQSSQEAARVPRS